MRSITLRGFAVLLLAMPLLFSGIASAAHGGRYFATLSADAEVPPSGVDASGVATVRHVDDSLDYQVSAYGLEETTAGHIHLGSSEENGPVVATLFSFAALDATAARTHDGLLGTGSLSDDDISTVEAADDPSGEGFDGTLASLIERIDAGEAYVNVHTVANPSGAIRGQLAAIEGTEEPGGWFADDDGNIHETNIDVLASPNLEVTVGCTDDEYCPDNTVTRGQIASFLYRAMNLPDADSDHFSDDDGSVHEAAINAAAEAGVLAGVGDGMYAPERELSRAQYASLISNALGLDDMGAEWPHELKQAADHVFGLGIVLGSAIDDQFALEGDATSGSESELNAADVRATLTDLAVEHTLLTGVTTGAALRGDTEVFANAAATLEENTVEFGATAGAFYGEDAEEAFLDLWREHIGYFVDYTNGVAANDEAMVEAALEGLAGYQQDIGALFEGATEGRVSQEAIATAFDGHVETLTAVIDAQDQLYVEGDTSGANWPELLKDAADHVFGLGTVLGAAIDDQFALEGDATSGTEGELNAADVRTTLTDLAVEHTLLTGVTTGAALRGETEVFESGAAALEANTVEFGATVGAFYGADAEQAFLDLWREHIGYFVDYTNGVAADDESQKEAALEGLREYQQDIGALFAGATEGRVTQEAIAMAFEGHVDTLTAVIRAQGRAAVAPPADAFVDDEANIHESSINLIADAGITVGCTADEYCPSEPISRAQMASLLVRALVWNDPAA